MDRDGKWVSYKRLQIEKHRLNFDVFMTLFRTANVNRIHLVQSSSSLFENFVVDFSDRS